MDHAAQEGTCRQDYGARGDLRPVGELNPSNILVLEKQISDFAFNDRKVGLGLCLVQHHFAINLAIRLCAWSLNCWPFASIEQPELDTCRICHAAHHPVQRINFADKMPFSKTTNRWVTGHHTNSIAPQSYQRDCHIHPRCRMGRLGPGVTTADYDDIKMALFHVKHSLFAQTEASENLIENMFHIYTTNDGVKLQHGFPDILSDQLFCA